MVIPVSRTAGAALAGAAAATAGGIGFFPHEFLVGDSTVDGVGARDGRDAGAVRAPLPGTRTL